MDRNKVYEKLRKMKNQEGELLWGDKSINNLKSLSDINLYYYLDYLNLLIENNSLDDSFKTMRSSQVDFLKFLSDKNLIFIDIKQDIVDEYFSMYSHQDSQTTNNRVNYLKNFISYFSINNDIDLDKHKIKSARNEAKMPIIKAAELSKAKNYYRKIRQNEKSNSTSYIVATKKLFVLEMFFYTDLSEKNIGKYFKGNRKISENSLDFNNKQYPVPLSLIELIREINESPNTYDTLDMKTVVNSMKIELSSFNMENLSSKGAEQTNKKLFWTCPQCGEKYLAIAENWCVKQYTDNGENWIVCREKCAHE